MADTQDDTLEPSTDPTAIPPAIAATLKQAIPQVSDQVLAGAWAQAVQKDPSVAKQDPNALAQAIIKAMSPQQGPGDATPVPPPPPPNVPTPAQAGNAPGGSSPPTVPNAQDPGATVNAQTAPLTPPAPTSNPFQGAGYTQADLQAQFNPNQVKAAYDTTGLQNAMEQQKQLYQQQLPGRIAAATFAANGTAGTGAANEGVWKSIDEQNLRSTVGNQAALLGWSVAQQKSLQEAATQGMAAGKSAVDIANGIQDNFGKFAGNVVNSLNTQQQQRFNDPNSPETQSAKAAILAQISTLPQAAKDSISAVVNKPGVTAQQLMPLMAQYVPAAFKAFTDAAGIGKTVADTAKTTTENINLQAQGKNFAAQQGNPEPQYPSTNGGVQPVTVGAGGSTTGAPAASGVKGNNPGNLREVGATSGFRTFPDMATGVKAMQDDIAAKGAQGLNTITSIVSKYAPSNENDTAAYIKDVSTRLGVSPTQTLDMSNPAVIQAISTAMMIHEQGGKMFGSSATAPAPQVPNAQAADKLKQMTAGATPADVAATTAAMKSGTPPSFATLKSALPDQNNMDPTYIANAKTSDLSPTQMLIRQRQEATDAPTIIALDKKIAAATGQPYIKQGVQTITLPSAGGNFSNEVNPAQTVLMHDSGTNIINKSNSVDTFQMSGKPAAQNAYLMADNSGFNKPSNWTPTTTPEASKLDTAVNRLNAEAARLGQVVNGPGSAGTAAAAGALGGLNPLLGAAASAFTALTGQTQAITSKSPPELIRQYSVATQVAAQRQAALLNFEQAYSASHNGNTAGFVGSPDYKMVMNAEPYVNPTTGDVVLPLTRSQQDSYLSQKDSTGKPLYGPLSSVSFATPTPVLK